MKAHEMVPEIQLSEVHNFLLTQKITDLPKNYGLLQRDGDALAQMQAVPLEAINNVILLGSKRLIKLLKKAVAYTLGGGSPTVTKYYSDAELLLSRDTAMSSFSRPSKMIVSL